MTRLVTFGCSMTYGEGLPDCISSGSPSPNPSKLAWPSLLSNKLSMECVNNSFPGRANKTILLDVLNTDIKDDDTVVIFWTYSQRGIIYDIKNYTNFSPHMPDNELQRMYYSLHNQYDLMMQSKLDIHHANLFLSTKKCKVYNFFIDPLLIFNSSGIDVEMKHIGIKSFKIDEASDKMHPGVLSQEKLSNIILNHMSK